MQVAFVTNELKISEIEIGDRFRQDLGDIAALAKSMRDIGLLTPITVGWNPKTQRRKLIAGFRRLTAAKELGWEKIPAHSAFCLEDALKALRAERDENICRKDFTPSEAVTIGKAIEELEKPKAKQRQVSNLKKGKASPVVESCHDGESNGKTRDKVAEAVGMSGRTYEKAKRVVEAAEKEPEKFGPVAEEMDRSGKVDAAYKKVREKDAPGQTMLDDFIKKKPASENRFDIFDESEKFFKLLVRRREDWPEFARKEFTLMARTCIERMEAEDEAEARIRGKATPAAKENSEEKTNGEIKVLGVGVIRAHEAINYLTRIPKNDALRERAFQIVTDWIERNA